MMLFLAGIGVGAFAHFCAVIYCSEILAKWPNIAPTYDQEYWGMVDQINEDQDAIYARMGTETRGR